MSSVKSTVINPPKLLDQVRDKLRVRHSSSVPSKLVQIGLNAMFYSMTSVISKDIRTAQELLGHSDVPTPSRDGQDGHPLGQEKSATTGV